MLDLAVEGDYEDGGRQGRLIGFRDGGVGACVGGRAVDCDLTD